MREPWKNETHERMIRAFLDILILVKLEHKSMNGYEITAFIIKKFGITISTSVVYSTLYSMERDGLVKGDCNRRGRVYELTSKGNKTLENVQDELEQIQFFINKLLSKRQNAELKDTSLFS
ncbi:MAG: PadR family transcriptional regulator [Candidatus Bathyarchaeia archaeon]|jgi:DNA-binding PadR family transcriptional regulator